MDSAVEKAGLSAEGCHLAADQQYRQAAIGNKMVWWQPCRQAGSRLAPGALVGGVTQCLQLPARQPLMNSSGMLGSKRPPFAEGRAGGAM